MIQPDYTVSLAFLKAWHPGGPWSLGAIDPDDRNGLAWLTTYDEAEVQSFLVEYGARRHNLYYQVGLCRPDLGDRRAGKDHVLAAVGLHADIDPPAGLGTLGALRAWQVETAARLETPSYWSALGLPLPSTIVFSGSGFQPLWRLAQPALLWSQGVDGEWRPDPIAVDAVEGRCLATLRKVDPQHAGTHNIDRLLRIPGTLNWPDARKRSRGRVDPELALVMWSDVTYDLAGFPYETPPRAAGREAHHVAPAQQVSLERLRAQLPEWLIASVLEGAPAGEDRSKVGFSTICSLLRCGIDDETIAAIVTDPAYKISGHYLDQANVVRAVNRALEAAHTEVDQELADRAQLNASLGRWTAPPDASAAGAIGAGVSPPPGAIGAGVPPPPVAPVRAPSDLDLDAALKSAQKRLSQRRDPDSLRDAELIRRVRGGEFLTDGTPDENDRKQALAFAAIAVIRAAPLGVTAEQVSRRLLPSAGLLALDVPQLVDAALAAVPSMPPMFTHSTARESRAQRAGAVGSRDPDDDGQAPLDEFVLEATGPRQGLPVASSQHNFDVALARLGISFSLDTFAYRKYVHQSEQREPADEDRMKEIPTVIEAKFGFHPPKDKFRDYCDVLAYKHGYHPVREYLDALPQWDDTDRLSTWLIRHAGAKDTPYVRAVSRLVLIAAVRRIKQPGCKFDEMLILEGNQGTEKSSLVRALCAQPEWFGPRLPFNGDERARMEATSGKWIIEAGELAGMDRRDHRELKDYLQRQEDEARLAYQREVRRTLRQFVVIGTTNDNRYLRDQTGNRRYWPILIQRCDVAGLIAERDQLWAEAVAAEAAGESIRLAPELWEEAAIEQEQRRLMDPFEVTLAPALEGIEGMLLTEDVWKLCGFTDRKPNPGDQQRMSDVMTRLGWSSRRRTKGRVRRYCFESPGATEYTWVQVVSGAGGWRCVAEGDITQPGTGLRIAGFPGQGFSGSGPPPTSSPPTGPN